MSNRTPKKQTMRSIQQQINASKVRLAKDRDKLRELIEDAQEIESCCDEAIEGLEVAADFLSRHL